MFDPYEEFRRTVHQYDEIPIAEFNELAKSAQWQDGPWRDGFGDGYGEPYMPHRACWGTLVNGRRVKSET